MVNWVTDGAPGCLRIDASLLQSSASVDIGSQTSGAAVSNLLPSKSTELSGVGVKFIRRRWVRVWTH